MKVDFGRLWIWFLIVVPAVYLLYVGFFDLAKNSAIDVAIIIAVVMWLIGDTLLAIKNK